MEFFLALVNGWKPLINLTKSSALYVPEILDTLITLFLKSNKSNRRCSVKKVLNVWGKSSKNDSKRNVKLLVDLKFPALANKVLRSLRRWPTFHKNVSITLFSNIYFKEQISLAACNVYKYRDGDKLLPKPSV